MGRRPATTPDHSTDIAAAFAHLLFKFGRHEPIRAIEAIAAAIANDVDRGLPHITVPSLPASETSLTRHDRFAQRLAVLAAPFDISDHAEETPAFASCLRIARRAMAAAMSDPTGGATRFHAFDEAPQWARGMLPCASIGSFLFYRDDLGLFSPETSQLD